jgi:hypothetical protein
MTDLNKRAGVIITSSLRNQHWLADDIYYYITVSRDIVELLIAPTYLLFCQPHKLMINE